MAARAGRLGLVAGIAAVLMLTIGGCGQDAAPADQVPELTRSLARVDQAVAAQEYDAARTSIDRLVTQTERARDSGALDPIAADRILGAAGRLLDALPDGRSDPTETTPTPSPSETARTAEPSEATTPEPSEEKPDKPEKPDKHEKGPGKGKGKGH